MSVIHINQNNFREEVIHSDKKVLLDFWAPWCGPCRMIAPFLEEIAAQRPDVKVCKINVDEEEQLAQEFRVYSIPMLVVMEGGRIVNQASGARPKKAIENLL